MDITNLSVDKLKKMTATELKQFDEEEQKILLQILKELSTEGKSKTLENLWLDDYEEIPVDIDTFLDDPYYLGIAGRSIYPSWREELRKIFDPTRPHTLNEIVFTGAIGLGKTQIAITGIAYILYNLMCLRNPQQYYGTGEGNKIAIVLINISLTQSNIVAYSKLQTALLNSPWFVEHGTVYENKDKKTYIPPKDIVIIVGSKESHIIGTDVFCLTGDTVVQTDGGIKTLEELSNSDKPFRVKQFNPNIEEFVWSDLTYSHNTKMTSELIELTLEDGSVIKCTPEHKLLVRNGADYKYKQAIELTEEDDLVVEGEEL